MARILAIASILCLFATTGLAQSGFNGKWATDRPDPAPILPAENRGRVDAEFKIEDSKVTGTIALGGLGGTFYVIESGKLVGNKIQFRTTYTVKSETVTTQWTGELVDENTLRLSRYSEVGIANFEPLRLRQALPASAPTLGQIAPSASVTGTVTDSSKANIPGVTVKATAVDTNVVIATVTNEAGVYVFSNLRPGKYTISASLSGFQTKSIPDVELSDNTNDRRNFELTIQPYIGFSILLHRVK